MPQPCLKFINVYSWLSGKHSHTPRKVYKILHRTVSSLVLHRSLPEMLNSSHNKILFPEFYLHIFMDARDLNMQLPLLRMKPFTTSAYIIALLTRNPLLEIHLRVISFRKYSLISIVQATPLKEYVPIHSLLNLCLAQL